MPRSCILIVLTLAGWVREAPGLASAEGLVQALPPSTAWIEGPALDDPGTAFDLPADDAGLDLPSQPVFLDRWTWQLLPDGVIYRSYLAGTRESRFASHWIREQRGGSLWDVTLGGRAGILRYGTVDPLRPQGWQLDIEGAAFPRLTLDRYRDLVSADFRFGVPLSFRRNWWETRFAYYHLSSHLGDEYLLGNPGAVRINYVRDALVWGLAFWPCDDLRLYAEAGYAFYISGGAQPWEFQFGIDYSPGGPTGALGVPFFAVNTRLREEVDFGGNLTVQTGWLWRGQDGDLLRCGFHYQNGHSDQLQFHTEHEEQYAIGVWYDF